MLQQYYRVVPFVLAGLLVFNVVEAVMDSTQGNWLRVGVMALLLAFTLWRRTRTEDTKDPPPESGPR